MFGGRWSWSHRTLNLGRSEIRSSLNFVVIMTDGKVYKSTLEQEVSEAS